MEYFNEEKIEEFKTFFIKELYSKMKFVQEDDPDDFLDPEAAYGDHIVETQVKLYSLINKAILEKDSSLNNDEVNEILRETTDNLFVTLFPEIDAYITQVEVDYK